MFATNTLNKKIKQTRSHLTQAAQVECRLLAIGLPLWASASVQSAAILAKRKRSADNEGGDVAGVHVLTSLGKQGLAGWLVKPRPRERSCPALAPPPRSAHGCGGPLVNLARSSRSERGEG